jgi:hypothetical protein
MYLREVGWGFINWIILAQDMDQRKPLVRRVMNVLVLQNIVQFLSS